MLAKKLNKLITKPNLFFYDYFAKRIGVPPAARGGLQDYAGPWTGAISSVELAHASPLQLLQNLFGLHSGAITGLPDQSCLLRCDQLRLFVNVVFEIAACLQYDLTLFTPGGGYFAHHAAGKGPGRGDAFSAYGSLQDKPDFVVELSGLGKPGFLLHAFLYDVNEDGQYSVRSTHAYVKKFPGERLGDLYPRAQWGEQDMRQQATPFPIDAVYTWVNKDDPGWQVLWNDTFPENRCDPDRFTSSDELKYSLRALDKYAPWIRRIYVVSNCARPSYIGDDPRLVWVDHTALFPDAACLPTFNSHAIEACLHLLPDLAEHFIYFNDDVFLNQPCYSPYFFDQYGRSVSYLEPYGMVVAPREEGSAPDYLVAANNSNQLLRRILPACHARQLHMHVPHALRKSVLAELEAACGDEFNRTRAARLRAASDVNVTSFLYHHYALVKGYAVQGSAPSLIVRPENVAKLLRDNNDLKYRFLCFNDGNGSALHQGYKTKFAEFCKRRFAHACSLENR